MAQVASLTARVAELEAKLGLPPKTPELPAQRCRDATWIYIRKDRLALLVRVTPDMPAGDDLVLLDAGTSEALGNERDAR